jgi:molybdate transport system permease protein
VAVLVVPVLGLVLQTPWSSLTERLRTPEILSALRLSLVTATISTALCLLLGVPLAWVLARVRFRGRKLVRALVTVPLVLPPVVGGIALLVTLGRRGVVGGPLADVFGIQIPFTVAAVVIAQTFVALPFLVLSVEGALRSADQRFDEVAATLGAGRWWTFVRVTLPLTGPGVASGAVLAWARALGEFGATITFAGSVEGVTRTMPLEIYASYNDDRDAALVLSLLLLAVSVLVLTPLRERWLGTAR